jgi:hypothetical protein
MKTKTNDIRPLWGCLCLLVIAAWPLAASAALLDASGNEIQTWMNTINISYLPTIVTVGAAICIVIWCIARWAGAIAFVCLVLGCFAYGARTPLIAIATGGGG